MKTITLKTYRCKDCDYVQDFDPNTDEHIKIHGKGKNVCPSCGGKMKLETDNDKKVKVNILEDSDIDVMDLTKKEKQELKKKRDKNELKLNDKK